MSSLFNLLFIQRHGYFNLISIIVVALFCHNNMCARNNCIRSHIECFPAGEAPLFIFLSLRQHLTSHSCPVYLKTSDVFILMVFINSLKLAVNIVSWHFRRLHDSTALLYITAGRQVNIYPRLTLLSALLRPRMAPNALKTADAPLRVYAKNCCSSLCNC